jgi:hypothetical protein
MPSEICKFAWLISVVLFLGVGNVSGADFQKRLDAARKGDFTTAFRE